MNGVRNTLISQKFKHLLFQSGLILSLVLICHKLLFMLEPPALILPVLAGLGIIIFIFIKLEFGIYILILASAFNRYAIESAGLTIRPDQAMAVLVLPSLFLSVASGRKQLHRNPLDLPIICFVLVNIWASLTNSPQIYLRESLQRCAMIFIASLCYFVIVNSVDREELLKKSIGVFLTIGVLEAVYGISAILLSAITNISIGVQGGYALVEAAPYGTLLEGNIFGSFLMVMGLILITYFLSGYYRRWRKLIGLCFGLVMIGLVLSYTRAAWGGFILGLALLPFLTRKRLFSRGFRMTVIVSVMIILFATIFSTRIFKYSFETGYYMDRFLNIVNTETGTGRSRLEGFAVAISRWENYPYLGNGTDTMALNPLVGWIPNIFIITLHDTGMIGLTILLWLLGVYLFTCLFTLRRMKEGFYKANLIAFLVSFIGLMVAYQATTAHWLGFVWVHMGLTMTLVRLSLYNAEVR